MATIYLPVDPSKANDVHYRYKMPATQTKVEGSGNGIKTVIPNIHDVCDVLHRPESVVIRFFSIEFGAQGSVDKKDDKYLVMGNQPNERVQEKMYEFIQKYVLCEKCANPETIPLVERKTFKFKCAACGHTTVPTGRVVDSFVKFYTDNDDMLQLHQSQVKTDLATEKKEEDKTTATKAGRHRAVDEGEALADTRRNDIEVATEHVQKLVGEPDALYEAIQKMLKDYNRTEVYGPIYLFHGVEKAFPDRKLPVLRQLAGPLRQLCVIKAGTAGAAGAASTDAELYKRQKKLQTQFLFTATKDMSAEEAALALFFFFVDDVVEDRIIADFVNSKHCAQEHKDKCKPLIDWFALDAGKDAAAKDGEAAEEEEADEDAKGKKKKSKKAAKGDAEDADDAKSKKKSKKAGKA